MGVTYASARRKWAWAEQHKHALEADFKRLAQFKGEMAALQFDHDAATNRIKGSVKLVTIVVKLGDDVPRLSDDFPLILGDAIHNYRSTLDHLTWDLVKRFGAKLNRKQAMDVQFPIHTSAAAFKNMRHRRTPGVPDKPHRALIKRYQPYRRGDGPKAIGWLNTLSSHDKHRELIPSIIAPKGVLIAAQSLTPGVQLLGYRALLTGPSAINPGTPVAELDLSVPLSLQSGQAQVAVNTKFTLLPLLSRKRHIGGVLEAISATTLTIIEAMEAEG
ncbi:MAG TPA: hypothetical protein VGR41_08300 [Actinomycetota bacterium]|jgi:hypothetical protein|nr:hypothetical protein [Actinomycetota bacterium]